MAISFARVLELYDAGVITLLEASYRLALVASDTDLETEMPHVPTELKVALRQYAMGYTHGEMISINCEEVPSIESIARLRNWFEDQ